MKTLILILLIVAMSCSGEKTKQIDYCSIETVKAPVKTSEYGRYVLLSNNRYTAVKVTVWHDDGSGWIVVDRINLPAMYTKSFGYNKGESLFQYGYSVKGDKRVRRFYSDHIEIQ